MNIAEKILELTKGKEIRTFVVGMVLDDGQTTAFTFGSGADRYLLIEQIRAIVSEDVFGEMVEIIRKEKGMAIVRQKMIRGLKKETKKQ